MGKIILIGATKGGVGKTVSTYNLAYSLASMGEMFWLLISTARPT